MATNRAVRRGPTRPRSTIPDAIAIPLSITMHRTYLGRPGGLVNVRQLAMFETYEAFVHSDEPDIPTACTHDEPDILFTMNRTYLARALTMNRHSATDEPDILALRKFC